MSKSKDKPEKIDELTYAKTTASMMVRAMKERRLCLRKGYDNIELCDVYIVCAEIDNPDHDGHTLIIPLAVMIPETPEHEEPRFRPDGCGERFSSYVDPSSFDPPKLN
jgi:hypothetical protein